MARLKNERHNQFLHEYFVCNFDGAKAYRRVYGNVKTAHVQAHKVLAKPWVRKELNRMMARIIKRADITEEKILTQYQQAYDLAVEQGKPAEMVTATSAQAKLVGLLRDRLEAGAPGDFERMDNVSDVLQAMADQIGPDVALKIGQALGIAVAIEHQVAPPAEEAADLAEAKPASDSLN